MRSLSLIACLSLAGCTIENPVLNVGENSKDDAEAAAAVEANEPESTPTNSPSPSDSPQPSATPKRVYDADGVEVGTLINNDQTQEIALSIAFDSGKRAKGQKVKLRSLEEGFEPEKPADGPWESWPSIMFRTPDCTISDPHDCYLMHDDLALAYDAHTLAIPDGGFVRALHGAAALPVSLSKTSGCETTQIIVRDKIPRCQFIEVRLPLRTAE